MKLSDCDTYDKQQICSTITGMSMIVFCGGLGIFAGKHAEELKFVTKWTKMSQREGGGGGFHPKATPGHSTYNNHLVEIAPYKHQLLLHGN